MLAKDDKPYLPGQAGIEDNRLMPNTSSKTSWLDEACEAVRFLTVFRLPSRNLLPENALARSMFFSPAVGFLIGGLSLGLFRISEIFFPPRIATLILLVVPILVSGGLHVDGFADFCDGFFGGKDKSDILRIMKDSRVGAWGALGVALLVLTKFELLQSLPLKAPFFLMAMAASRWAQVLLSFSLPYAGLGGGVSESVAGKVGWREVLGATLFLTPLLFWLQKEGVFILGALALFLFLLGFYFKKKVGGITGDLLGAVSELTEVFVLLLAIGIQK